MIKGTVSSPTAAIKYINTLKTDALKTSRLAVIKSTLAVHEEAIRLVTANVGGHAAVRNGKNVTVSDPFEPPHKDTGRLVQSIKFNISATGEYGEVGSNMPLAAWLEFGTATMAPRPWLSLAVENMKDKIANIFVDFFEKDRK